MERGVGANIRVVGQEKGHGKKEEDSTVIYNERAVKALLSRRILVKIL